MAATRCDSRHCPDGHHIARSATMGSVELMAIDTGCRASSGPSALRLTVRRLRDARNRKRKSGQRVEGRLPFGSYPGEEDTLKDILTMHIAGMQPGAIAAALNAAGVSTRSGKPWIRQVLGPIIRRRRVNLAQLLVREQPLFSEE